MARTGAGYPSMVLCSFSGFKKSKADAYLGFQLGQLGYGYYLKGEVNDKRRPSR